MQHGCLAVAALGGEESGQLGTMLIQVATVIEADPKLVSLFREHSVNIEPALYSLDAQGLASVNRRGTFRYDILYLASGWKGFEFSGTPQFYFVKGGEVIYKIAGAKQQDFRGRLAEGLAKVGL